MGAVWAAGQARTIPYRRSRARRRMDSSLSSRHCSTRSLCACTDLGCVLRILDMARSPRYFTAETAGSRHTCTRFGGEARLQLHPHHLDTFGHASQAPGSPHCQPRAPQTLNSLHQGKPTGPQVRSGCSLYPWQHHWHMTCLPTPARQLLCYPGRDHMTCRVDPSYSLALPRKNSVTSAQNQQIWSASTSACLVNLQGDCRPMRRSPKVWPAPPRPRRALDLSPRLPQPPHPSLQSGPASPWTRAQG